MRAETLSVISSESFLMLFTFVDFFAPEGRKMLITRWIASTGLVLSVTAMLSLATVAEAQNILYQHNFTGSAATPLHRLPVDIDNNGGGNAWTTRTSTGLPSGTGIKYSANGNIDAAISGSGAASLGFTPVAGNIYTFTVRFGAITSGNADFWVAMGYSAGFATGPGAGAEFYGNGNPDNLTGQPWQLYRQPVSTSSNQTFLGPGTTSGVAWPTSVTANRGDPVDLQIVLNTTTPLWSAEWLAKNPTDATYTSLRSTTYTTNPNIRTVAVTSLFTVGAKLDSFSLTTSGPIYVAGDTNGDGNINTLDFDTIRNNFFKPLLGPTNGDLNNDGIVDYVDFRVWKSHAAPGAAAAVGGFGVPEPTSVLLGALGLLLSAPLALRQRRKPRSVS